MKFNQDYLIQAGLPGLSNEKQRIWTDDGQVQAALAAVSTLFRTVQINNCWLTPEGCWHRFFAPSAHPI
jgi:hypothetical protein